MISERIYDMFCDMFVAPKQNFTPFMDFNAACSILGADPASLDNMLYERLGMSGDEIFEKIMGGSVGIAV